MGDNISLCSSECLGTLQTRLALNSKRSAWLHFLGDGIKGIWTTLPVHFWIFKIVHFHFKASNNVRPYNWQLRSYFSIFCNNQALVQFITSPSVVPVHLLNILRIQKINLVTHACNSSLLEVKVRKMKSSRPAWAKYSKMLSKSNKNGHWVFNNTNLYNLFPIGCSQF